MATYITKTQLASEARLGASGFTSNTNPTDTMADSIIAQVEAEVDSKLAMSYTLPLVTQVNKDLVAGIALAIAAARVRKIIDAGGTIQAGSKTVHQTDEENARARLQQIVDGSLVLQSEDAAVSVHSFAASHDLSPVFRKGCKQW